MVTLGPSHQLPSRFFDHRSRRIALSHKEKKNVLSTDRGQNSLPLPGP